MNLTQLLDHANTVTDEFIDFKVGVKFINDCIARINTEMQSGLPYYSDVDTMAEVPIPQKWQLTLIVPFVAAKIKQIDSSQFEYTDLFGEFERNLQDFTFKYVVRDDYKILVEDQEIKLPNGSVILTVDDETLHEIAAANSTTVKDIIAANEEILFVGEGFEMNGYQTHYFGGDW